LELQLIGDGVLRRVYRIVIRKTIEIKRSLKKKNLRRIRERY